MVVRSTGGDVSRGLALDGPRAGWGLASPEAATPVMAALLAGDPVALAVEAGDPGWLTGSRAAFTDDAPLSIRLTAQSLPGSDGELVIHPAVLALGVGCERDTGPDELIALADRTLDAHGLARQAVACVVSLDLTADAAAVHELAARLGLAARFFDPPTLHGQDRSRVV